MREQYIGWLTSLIKSLAIYLLFLAEIFLLTLNKYAELQIIDQYTIFSAWFTTERFILYIYENEKKNKNNNNNNKTVSF